LARLGVLARSWITSNIELLFRPIQQSDKIYSLREQYVRSEEARSIEPSKQ